MGFVVLIGCLAFVALATGFVALQGYRYLPRSMLRFEALRSVPLGWRVFLIACGVLGGIGAVLLAIAVER